MQEMLVHNSKSGTPQVRIEVDRDKAADLGVSSSDVASTLSTLFNGSTVSKYDGGKDRYDVKVSIDDNERKNLNDLDGYLCFRYKKSTSSFKSSN